MTDQPLTADEIQVGRVYSGKNPSLIGLPRVYNDRQVVWIDPTRTRVQYDGPAVAIGRHRPIVRMDAFLKWARADVTDQCPPGDWRGASDSIKEQNRV